MLKRFWTWFVTGGPSPHQWTPWTIVSESEGLFGFPMTIQSRRCVTCGWTERTPVDPESCYTDAERRELAAGP